MKKKINSKVIDAYENVREIDFGWEPMTTSFALCSDESSEKIDFLWIFVWFKQKR